jgi:ParB/RepB/Spo0J family partition protein
MPTQLTLGDESKIKMPNLFGGKASTPAALTDAQSSRPIVGEQYRSVKLSSIVRRSPLQTRAPFDPEQDEEDRALVEYVQESADKLPPVLLVEIEPGQYGLLDGHRRCDALQHVAQDEVRAIIKREGTLDCDLITLSANVRKNLTQMELAWAVGRLRREHQLAVKEITKKVGLTERSVELLEELLHADPPIQAEVERGRLSANAARALSKAPTESRPQLTQIAATHTLSEKETKRLIARVTSTGESPEKAALSLGFTPTNGEKAEQSKEQSAPTAAAPQKPHPESSPGKTPGRNHKQAGRKRERALTMEAAMAMSKDLLPELEPRLVKALSEQATKHSISLEALKIAGLLMVAGQGAGEAIKVAAGAVQTPAGRKLAGLLTTCRELQGLLEQDRLMPECLPALTVLSKKIGGLKQASASRTVRG